jgi:hypothetical protein
MIAYAFLAGLVIFTVSSSYFYVTGRPRMA